LFISAVCLLISCGTGDVKHSQNENDPKQNALGRRTVARELQTSIDCKQGTILDYKNFGQSFALKYCTSCHSSELPEDQRTAAPIDINFNTLEGIQIWRGRILKVAGSDGVNTMPPIDNIPTEERKMFADWLKCGAPGYQDSSEL
jgi:uncharacterized membrane protein